MTLRAPSVFVLVLVAGCLGSAPDVVVPEAGLAFDAPILVDPEVAHEPAVAVDPEGRIWYVSPMCADGSYRLSLSEDEGRSWKRFQPDPTQGTCDSAIAIRSDGSVYVTELNFHGLSISASHDYGETWWTVPVALPVAGLDRPWMTVDAEGRVYAVASTVPPQTGTTWVVRSEDGGRTWVPLGVAWHAADWGVGINVAFVTNPRTGALQIVHHCLDNEGLCLTESMDGGETWASSVVVDRGVNTRYRFATAAVDGEGNMFAAWVDASEGDTDVWLARSLDAGKTWLAPVKVNGGVATHVFPSIAARGAGDIAVAWLSTGEPVPDHNDAEAMKGVRWSVRVARTANSLDPAPRFVEAEAVGPIHEGSVSTRGWNPGESNSGRMLGDFITAALDQEGRVLVAYSQTVGSDDGWPVQMLVRSS